MALDPSRAARAAHPSEPWLWRRDWAGGRAEGRDGGSLAAVWVVTLLWNAIASTVAWVVLRGPARSAPALLGVALFPAAGIGLLVWALRATLRRARFGRTFVRLDTLPAPLGGRLRGTLHARFVTARPSTVRLTLGCVHRVTSGSGNHRSSFEHIRWQDAHDVSDAELSIGPRGATAIPVEFAIPRELPATDAPDASNPIRWLLRAQAAVPGIDLDEVYEVPVFETADSPTAAQWSGSTAGAAPVGPPLRPTIGVSPGPGGGTVYAFRAARNPGMAAGVTLFAVAFAGVEWFLVHARAPAVLPVVFGLVVVLLAWSAVALWFTRTRVLVDAGRLTVQSTTLGLRRTRAWSRDEARSIGCRIGMQSGQGARGIPYYDVVLTDASGRQHVVGPRLRDHHEAEWIARQLGATLGLTPGAGGP